MLSRMNSCGLFGTSARSAKKQRAGGTDVDYPREAHAKGTRAQAKRNRELTNEVKSLY